MKYLFSLILSFVFFASFSQNGTVNRLTASPLASYSNEWNDVKYAECNTAASVSYMTSDEKEVIYILNLIRSNPKLFANTVLKKYPSTTGRDQLLKDAYYYGSLMDALRSMKPLEILYPDKDSYSSAECHAATSGAVGYLGHERKTKDCKAKKHYYGECCDYGNTDPLDIVLSLLIDKGVPSLGHRSICFGAYTKIGVSIRPHSRYGTNTVLDFYY